MAFTKINAAGIGTTETVTVDGLTVINDGSFGGNLSVGGTITYEDVTNVDSVGIITARAGVLVGSGITLSKDGDVFFTGIATGNGSGLTALNASNLASGTVPTARLGSGTASSSTFLRGDSTFQTVNTDLVSDTSPQLGGDLDTNDHNILLDDDHLVKFGASNDLEIFHDSSAQINYIKTTNTSTPIQLQAPGGEIMLKAIPDQSIELYENGTKVAETTSGGFNVEGVTYSNGLDMDDSHKILLGTDDDLEIFHNGSNAYVKNGTGQLLLRSETHTFENAAGSSEYLRIDSSGRIGVGVVPTAQFNHNLIQIGNQATLGANAALSVTGQTFLTHNLYFDPSGNYQVFNTSSANEGTILRMVDGNFTFSNSAATTGTPTVTERLRITDDGNLGLGTNGDPMDFVEFKNSAAQKKLVLSKSNSGTADQNGMWLQFNNYGPSATARAADTIIGKLHFYASQPTSGNLQDAGAIECRADGSQTGNVTKSYLSLLTVDTNTAIERLRIAGNGTLQFRNINATATTDNVASVNFIGPYVYQHSKTVTATTNGSGAVTFDLGCPFIYDGSTFEYFLNASPTDNTNFTTTYQKGFFTKARGGGLGQFHVVKNDSAKAGCSLGTPTAGNPNGHQFNVAISGAVANKEYRATILYTGISRYNGY